MARTIQETIDHLHSSLKEYIEATYHIGDPALITQRRKLLERIGVTHQEPFLESTPKYQVGRLFKDMDGLPAAARAIYEKLSGTRKDRPRLIFDPPYRHQGDAVQHALIEGKNLVIMTGTGSGKTESFLLPILGKFAREAAERPASFGGQPAMRALLLYPMNALVNDQLGRLRAIFGDPDLVTQFTDWAGRPPRFARYTSRTPYAGVRSGKKDGRKLSSFESFYVEIERQAEGHKSEEQEAAAHLRSQLKDRGKWPAKPDLDKWFGTKNSRWYNPKTETFLRAVTLPEDSELITRHEVQASCPDLLVTNYSMLEYMMMRPIERSIFDNTRNWLAANPAEKMMVVLDEAHLYRGAAGAEVGLLLRRLRDRLDVPAERFQIVCATASFNDREYAAQFGAQLSGIPAESFVAVTGDLDLRPHAAVGTTTDAEVLADLDLKLFYSSEEADRTASIAPFLKHRGVTAGSGVERDLFQALKDFGPLGRLVNTTMGSAQPVVGLGAKLFPDSPEIADQAVTTLLTLGSVAREQPDAAGPLPCRIHNFYRGLPGLWVCMDPDCVELAEEERNGISGKMFSQPHETCGCGSRVLEFFTCRNCGSAYARAYSDDLDCPDALWSEPGRRLHMPGGETVPLLDLDLLLEEPRHHDIAEMAEYDLDTGRLAAGQRTRTVYIRKDRLTPAVDDDGETDTNAERRGQFVPCGVCRQTARGRTTVQNHQTKGDQPFQALVSRQLSVQPPGKQAASRFAPLRGRKVLVFSDSRQVAARLAPNLQMYSVRDALRPLIVWGFDRLGKPPVLQQMLSLDELYLAVLLASQSLGVRLRPERKSGENFSAVEDLVAKAIAEGALTDDNSLTMLWMEAKGQVPPAALLDDIVKTVQDKYLGLEALALASIRERVSNTKDIHKLPPITGIAETEEDKVALARAWLRCWRPVGFWLNTMPIAWYKRPKERGTSVGSRKGAFAAMDVVLKNPAARKAFRQGWTRPLLDIFTQDMDAGNRRLSGQNLSLQLVGEWKRCASCKSVHRPVRTIPHCLDCGSDEVVALDPTQDSVFSARKGYYRSPALGALATPPEVPIALIAAEHTAQLNAPQSDDVFSKAEENELLFQDVELNWGSSGRQTAAIDVLSSTTTMEVGIDIGALSGVALRNMPPGRANYQQRAGRAGRRGNAVATVVAFGSADSHDEHYFSEPKEMISGKVIDPKLTLDNPDIVKRHIRAYLLQAYHQVRLPVFDPNANPDLFSVLGSVQEFKTTTAPLNVQDFKAWLIENERGLRGRVASWIPHELIGRIRDNLLDEMISDCISAVEQAIANDPAGRRSAEEDDGGAENRGNELPEEVGEEVPPERALTGTLLDRLLYEGVLPRYAFPTDVATFNVFDIERSTPYRPVMRFAPSQGLPVALSQYAPGKQVWISGKCYTSGAIYSPMAEDRFGAWQKRRLYRECSECSFAETVKIDAGLGRDVVTDCRACGCEDSFGPTRYWLRPPGFAHRVDQEVVTSPDDMPETSYATRAKLVMPTPADDSKWTWVNDRIRVMPNREHLLVSNTGPKQEGYNYCTLCGRIESSAEGTASMFAPHPKPFPDKEATCPGTRTSRHVVLGTDFITDIALFSMRVEAPLKLKPGYYPTEVALRTVSEALAKAACGLLGVEPGELMAEYRPALTPAGKSGLEAEIFLYDTLPGGAGFSRQLAERGDELFRRALTIMETCPEDCDASCYRCLRSFKNKFEHGQLDRHVGAELLKFLLTDRIQPFSLERVAASTRILMLDLERNADNGVTYETDAVVNVPGMGEVAVPILAVRPDGRQFVIAVAGPLTADHPASPLIAELRERWDAGRVIPINELLVRGNLPAATRIVEEAVLA
ncbi:DEAD/DEAH box helicase [Methylobacterium sp. 1030]|uniref:DEAD/DEAH box helicase n=1 Tax=Methylobacterium sp. 1030 TaxID=3156404 RepID=UPI003399EAED